MTGISYDKLSIWPSLSTGDLLLILVSLVLIILTFTFTRKLYIKKERSSSYWHAIYQFALKRGLDKNELEVLKGFVDIYPKKQMAELLISRKIFYSELIKYLRSNKQIDVELEVRMLDKLFRSFDDQVQIQSVRDLKLGENVSLNYSDRHILCTVVSGVKGGVLLSTPETGIKPGKVSLYAFRPKLGGFTLQGKLLNSRSKALHFHSDEQVTTHGDAHLMALLELPARLSIWHDSQIESESIADADQVNEVLQVVTDRISDRAFMFASDEELNLDSIWQVELTLPDGFVLNCRGKLIAARREHIYIFKFIDISPALRQVLFSEITQHQPIREQFS